MKNKKADIPYCGVRRKTIKNAHPELDIEALNMFMYYVKERYSIHIKKDFKHENKPWTKDPILRQYRFTNVRREHDIETQYLIRSIADNDFLSYRQKMLNIVLFRAFNKHQTFEIMGAPFKFEWAWTYKPARKKLLVYREENPEYTFFTNAYLSSGFKRTLNTMFPQEDFVPGTVLRFLKHLNENDFFDKITSAKTQKEAFEAINSEKGIGEFLSYQIFVDFTYIKDFPFSENEFTVAGIGCKKGIDFLFNNRDGMSYEECVFWMRDNWENLTEEVDPDFKVVPEDMMIDLKHYDRVMNVMSLENCFCEFSKYYKTTNNLGRPRSRYKQRRTK